MSKRILIIDDEADIREVARASLEFVGGFEVSVAASGAEGISMASQDPPDAILLDLMMPSMDGLQTLSSLRMEEKTRGIPVIFLTAKVSHTGAASLSREGAAGVLFKPFDPMTLPEQLRAMLHWNLQEGGRASHEPEK